MIFEGVYNDFVWNDGKIARGNQLVLPENIEGFKPRWLYRVDLEPKSGLFLELAFWSTEALSEDQIKAYANWEAAI